MTRCFSINRKDKTVSLKNSEDIVFDKLVIGTGSLPYKPEWLPGVDLENVFTVPKDKNYLDGMQQKLESCQKIIVIGAGFIGVEISDELKKCGKEVILIEKLPRILGLAFDEDISSRVRTMLDDRGVQVLAGTGVKEIRGKEKVNSVVLDNDKTLEADAVILAMGYRPNTTLAAASHIPISNKGFY